MPRLSISILKVKSFVGAETNCARHMKKIARDRIFMYAENFFFLIISSVSL
jgi:hypothetical protein